MVYSSVRLVANIAGVGIELFGFIEVYVTCCIQLYWHVLILAVRHFRHSELNMESRKVKLSKARRRPSISLLRPGKALAGKLHKRRCPRVVHTNSSQPSLFRQ
jgi:hypothetical protein